jgi:uncharacterized protein YndB with AHSA1/START domain
MKPADAKVGVAPELLRDVTEHINTTHRAELTIIARANGAPWAQDATLEAFDLAGLDLHALHGARLEAIRVNFDTPVSHANAIEDSTMETLARSRAKLGMPPVDMIVTDLEGSGSHNLPHAPGIVFTALRSVRDYPAWLPPVGRVLEVNEPVLVGSRFTMNPRGRNDAVMTMAFTKFEPDRALEMREDGGHAHLLRFTLEPFETGTRLHVTVGNRAPTPPHELEAASSKLGTLGGIIAKKLEAHLAKETS